MQLAFAVSIKTSYTERKQVQQSFLKTEAATGGVL